MTYHLFGSVLTPKGIASNNRGETAGNVSTLQKVIKDDAIYTSVSAEAIRYAMRERWTQEGESVNRRIQEDGSDWQDTSFENWEEYLDDDLLGYMNPKEETDKRRGRLEVSRALSTQPWSGDVSFGVASVGAQPSGNVNPVPFTTEIHATRYQYLVALTPSTLAEPARALDALDAVQNLRRVAGNHSRYLYDFAPSAVILRWTHDPAPRLMYCFEEDEYGAISAPKIIEGIQSGDLDAGELVAGGPALRELRDSLRELDVSVHDGVKAAFAETRDRVVTALALEES